MNFTPPNRQASAVPTSSTAVHRFAVYPGILAHFLPRGACTESINYIPQNFL